MNLFDSTLKSIQNSLFLKENENVFAKAFDTLSPDEKAKLVGDLVKRSANPNDKSVNPDIFDKFHQAYTTQTPTTSASSVPKKEVTVPGGSVSAPASYVNTSVSTKL
jgi:hypothetical protein